MAYLLLKIAMEIQDKSKMAEQAPANPTAQKMQRVRFRRFADLFKIGLDVGLPELDLYYVFFHKGTARFLSPALRKNIILHCVGNADNTKLLNYLVILEANDNPYAV